MDRSKSILYDAGRFPLWLRCPALVFGLFMLWVGAAIASAALFGLNLGLPQSDEHGSPALGALLGFAMASIWIYVWFARLRILFDPKTRELILWSRGFLGCDEHRVALDGCCEIHIRHTRGGFAGRKWRVTLECPDGCSQWLADIPCKVDSLADALRKTTCLPVIKYEGTH